MKDAQKTVTRKIQGVSDDGLDALVIGDEALLSTEIVDLSADCLKAKKPKSLNLKPRPK